MPRLRVPTDTLTMLRAFKPFVEGVMEEELDDEAYFDLVIHEGITRMFRALLDQLDQGTLVESMLQLAAIHPKQVFDYAKGRLEMGAEVNRQPAREKWMGFIKSR